MSRYQGEQGDQRDSSELMQPGAIPEYISVEADMLTNQELLIELLYEETYITKDELLLRIDKVRQLLEEENPGSTCHFDKVFTVEEAHIVLSGMRDHAGDIVDWFSVLYRRAVRKME